MKAVLDGIRAHPDWELVDTFGLDIEESTHVRVKNKLDDTNCDIHYRHASNDGHGQKLYLLEKQAVFPATEITDSEELGTD